MNAYNLLIVTVILTFDSINEIINLWTFQK